MNYINLLVLVGLLLGGLFMCLSVGRLWEAIVILAILVGIAGVVMF